MKTWIVLSLLIVITACGKNGSSSSSGDVPEAEFVDVSTTGVQADLLNVTLEVPVKLGVDRIQILRSVSLTDQGSRKTCSFQVNANEEWFYTLTGNSLSVETGSGAEMVFKRLSGNSIQGIWTWSGPQNGMKIIRRLSLLDDRLILNQDCEG